MSFPDWLQHSRWFGLAIAGTLIPYTVFALSVDKTPTERQATKLIVDEPWNSPVQDTPAAGEVGTGQSTLPPTPVEPAESRSPMTRLAGAIRDYFTPSESEPLSASSATASAADPTSQVNPFALFFNRQSSASSSLRSNRRSRAVVAQMPVLEDGVPLTLKEAIAIAIVNNTTVKNAYLDRIVERAELRVAQGDLNPKLTPILSTDIERNALLERDERETGLRARVSWFVPTGGTLNVDWRTQLHAFEETGARGVSISFVQPLLRYGESTIARLERQRAIWREDINLLKLRDILSTEVTQTITAYRALLLAQEQVKQTQISLDNAQAELAQQQALVDAGRRARYTLLGSQQNVANFRSQLLGAQNAVQSAQLALMNQLGSDRDLHVVAVMDDNSLAQPELTLDPRQIEQTSFAQRPDYLQRLIQLKIAEMDQSQASNQRLWQLDLVTNYDRVLQTNPDWSATLELSQNLGERRRQTAAFKQAEVALLKQQNELAQAEADIKIEVNNQIREVRLQRQQWQLAQEEVQLAEQELAAQQALIRAGRGESFQLQDIQRRLLAARNQELAQRINYLNAITQLEVVQGITLQRWGIQIDPQR